MAKVRTVAHEIPTETPAAINWLRTWIIGSIGI